ncbi:hypothetical protein BGZ58_009813 [Dissophora ornata]|nr:hypothetical protein BGZ58_009813 [Dissophora ornata]
MAIWEAPTSTIASEDVMDDSNPLSCFTLTRTQRLYGFGVCFITGFLISILSTLALTTAQLGLFAVFFTLGNVVSLLSTTFLIGPTKQIKTMLAPVRRIASIIFIVLIIVTFIVAFTIQSSILCLILCLIQFLALFWYSASYIPYGRAAIKKIVGGCIEV